MRTGTPNNECYLGCNVSAVPKCGASEDGNTCSLATELGPRRFRECTGSQVNV